MQLARPLTLNRRSSGTRRPALSIRRARHAAAGARERNQRANISQDAATYSCECGYVFTAAVTTSVGCPHCGTDQAW
jgi:Zn finger protein HypA/HybF involved in hydrogenase expression